MSHRIAIIGLGIIGRRMIEQSRLHGGLTVVSAWDAAASARAAALRDYPGLPIAADAHAAIAQANVDLVYVAVPPLAHYQYVLAAADRGKAVFCEKPLSVSRAEGQALVRLASERGLINAVNYVFASSHAVDALAKRLDDPAFGLQSIDIRMRFFQWPRQWQASAHWLTRADQGGPTREVLSHYVYLLERLFGRVRLIDSAIRRASPDASEHFSQATLDVNGTPVNMTALVGGGAPDEVLVQFHGRTQTLQLRDWYQLSQLQDGETRAIAGLPDDPRLATYQAQLQQVCALIAGQPHTLPDFAAAFRVQEIIEAILTD